MGGVMGSSRGWMKGDLCGSLMLDQGVSEWGSVGSLVDKVMGVVRVEWGLLNIDFYTFSSTVTCSKDSYVPLRPFRCAPPLLCPSPFAQAPRSGPSVNAPAEVNLHPKASIRILGTTPQWGEAKEEQVPAWTHLTRGLMQSLGRGNGRGHLVLRGLRGIGFKTSWE